jgi:hypothetical protein
MSSGPIYTDMCASLELRSSQGDTLTLPRYGVWVWDPVRRRRQVADVGDDLQALRDKYGEGPLVDLPGRTAP